MTDSGYNQILVIIDHFTKLAEAVPCQTAFAEETCKSLDNALDFTIWLSDHIPIGQSEGICGGTDKKTDERVPHCTGPFNDLPSINKWISGETEQNTSEHTPGVLLEIYD